MTDSLYRIIPITLFNAAIIDKSSLPNPTIKQQLRKAYKICHDAWILALAMVCTRIDRQNSYRAFWVLAYHYYLSNLEAWKTHCQIKVFAYCLMTNHVHLLLQPGDHPGTLGQFMKRVAARQTRYVNRLEGRSGTLWESRYKSSPVETEAYLLACARYIELNPVRALMVERPEDYPWSSFGHHVGKRHDSWLDIDPVYLSLARTTQERAIRYDDFVREAIPEGEWQLIRDAIQRGQLTGSQRFIDEIAVKLGKRIERRGQGRPQKGQ